MEIVLNNKKTEVEAATLQELAQVLQLPERGVAMALNQGMVQKASWGDTALKDGDSVLVIKAACGG